MAERATIARPYAKAAFDYARGAQALGAWSEGLETACEIIADPRVEALAYDPKFTAAQLAEFVIDVAGAKLDAGLQNFIRVLAENRRLPLLPEIAAHYAAARSEFENTADVEVISAVALDFDQAEKLAAAVSKRLKRRVRMHTSVDPALLGGAVIRAGDLVIDGSIKGRLQRLGTALAS